MSLIPYFKWLFVLFLLISCTTVKKAVIKYKLKEARDRKSEQVTYSPPPPPFQQLKNENLDAFWWNKTTQNSISYFSSCPKDGPLNNLQEIEKGVLSEVTDYKVIKTMEKKNTRHTQIRVPTDQGEIRNSIYIIKEAKCFYILNFVAGSLKSFKKDEPIFQKFISSFKGL